jgi:hypothetical protein
LAGRKHASHEDLVDPIGGQLRALQRCAYDMRAELMRAERRQCAHETAKRRSRGGHDDEGIMGGHWDLRWAQRFELPSVAKAERAPAMHQHGLIAPRRRLR